ncbi:MAG: hypothetical protein EU541_01195 [Promethearchaeota archaeon]|nr:MAG: hypothetical protein EU541_01195 [Candidatus Lokiarchaeota archaeon]
MLNIFLVECGVELIPKRIRSHPAVKRNLSMRNYSSQLLDNALHHSAMHNFKNRSKRGRPDIAHLCLLNALGSPLNKSGGLRVYMHTVKDRLFEFNPEIRIAKNYNRFKGLMAKLLIDNGIRVNETYLIKPLKKTLEQKIHDVEHPEILIFTENGKHTSHNDLYIKSPSKEYVAIIGGFQKANFSEAVLSLSNEYVSISETALNAWIVVSRAIIYYELANNIF